MSHQIIYGRLFVKAIKDEIPYYIPMIFSGANNCTFINPSSGREIRERDWYNSSWVTDGKLIANENEILQKIDGWRLEVMKRNAEKNEQYIAQGDSNWVDVYDDKKFGYFTSLRFSGRGTGSTSFMSYRNFHEIGMAKALTVEELVKEGIDLVLKVSSYSEEAIKKAGLIVKPDVTVTSSQHLLDTVNEYSEYYKGIDCLYFRYGNEWVIKRYLERKQRENKKPHKQKVKIEVDEYYVLEGLKVNGYFYKNTRRGYRYSYDSSSYLTKKFQTEKQANTFHKKMTGSQYWKVVLIKEKATLYV